MDLQSDTIQHADLYYMLQREFILVYPPMKYKLDCLLIKVDASCGYPHLNRDRGYLLKVPPQSSLYIVGLVLTPRLMNATYIKRIRGNLTIHPFLFSRYLQFSYL